MSEPVSDQAGATEPGSDLSPADLPGESADRLAEVEESISQAKESAGLALTDQPEGTNEQ